MRFSTLCSAAVLYAAAAAAAYAAPFGPATASLGSFDVPTVTINGGAGNDMIMLNGGAAQLSAGTGQFAGGTFPGGAYPGSGAGSLVFAEMPNTITSDLISSLFSFSDNLGGAYVFDLLSIDTISFSNAPGVSTAIGLYLLGTMFDTNLQLDSTPTSLTMTFNSTGASAYSESGSLANPPAPTPPIPEPASLALLSLGLVSLGALRRRG